MVERAVISMLNHLIETCRNGEMGYWNAAEHVQDAGIKSMFQSIARKRGQFADELKQEVQRLGGAPDEGGTVAGALHRSWMDMKSVVTSRDDTSIIAEAERGDESAIKAYETTLRTALPSPTQSIVDRQYKQVKEAHDRVEALEQEWRRRG
jgi:uncharacterized protein (TIGR02284 family)